MNRKLRNVFTVLIITASLAFPAIASAEQTVSSSSNAYTSTSTSSSDSSTSSSTSASDTTSVEANLQTPSARIAKFKTLFKINLSLTEISRIKLKCVAAQTIIGTLSTDFTGQVTPRTKAYAQLQTNLNDLVTKLKAKSVDTTTLEQNITVLNAKITTFNSDLTAYKQALSDLKAVDCKTDPSGFQAALLAARSAHDTLVADVLAIRTYLVKTVLPTLQTIKQQLASPSSSSSEGSN